MKPDLKSLKSNVIFKVIIIVVITMLLLIPTAMIESLISERQHTQEEAIGEVSSKWGESQTITGPIVSVPFFQYSKEYSKTDSTEKIVQIKEYFHFLPTSLKINGTILPELRNRGIYDIVVYNSKLNIAGNFSNIRFNDQDIPVQDIQFDKAELTIGITDLRGIEKQVFLKWNNQNVSFNPGVFSTDIVESGINAPVAITKTNDASYSFNFDLDLKGSQLLYFIPAGEITDINISSPWKNPKFNGAFLPDTRNISESGFTANWNILHLNRNFPQMWIGDKYRTTQSAFGIDLLLPVDNYQKSMRSVKYAILFIVFTFLVFFFVEVLNKTFIHPIQYLLVGIALIIFFALLLSISEHINFNKAFVLSAIATLALITGYTKAILKSTQLTALISSILLILYLFIFVIIQLQDYALLIGSIGLFVILAISMYFSRKIDWYNLNLDEK